ncbi:MAG: 4-alpha-glucanotransferase [Eubacterium sp.]|nr:4-alpha-glucanotransferase [Eubacterium sp.]
MRDRFCGILLPVSSLPSAYGIGSFSEAAKEWIRFLKNSKQQYWQILPLGPISYGDSPYQSFSTFAGNPLFIDLEKLIEDGLLSREACDQADLISDPSYVDYGKQYYHRYPLLYQAFENSDHESDPEFTEFCKKNKSWLHDYAVFMACKDSHDGAPWTEWEPDLKKRKKAALQKVEEEEADRIRFYEYLQYLFSVQWDEVRAYAKENGISIIGDIPIYVALDSADVWTNPKLFQLDKNLDPVAVAGCPPDAFCEDGQLWGNPLYDWSFHKKTGYEWWISRIRHCSELYDMVRIDHFRGFDEYYAVPFEEETARKGTWEPGPGMELFDLIKKEVPELGIIAEDLGFITDSVRKLVADSGFPNMKVLQFAFGSDSENEYLPNWYDENCVVYTGTHDNATLMQFIAQMPGYERYHVEEYLNLHPDRNEALSDGLIRLALGSVARYCIIPMQDYLQLGAEARINTPSTLGGNWEWRMSDWQMKDERLAEKIRYLCGLFGRFGHRIKEEEKESSQDE